MLDDAHFDDLERYLLRAQILDVATFSVTTAHRSYRVIFEGGVAAMVKPTDGISGDVDAVVRREVAAWVIARELGWPDMVATTVLREFVSPTAGEPVMASFQIVWPDVDPDGDAGRFTEDDQMRAAVFDIVVNHCDRSGHNWLGVPQAGSPQQLKLIDHGYAFDHAGNCQSSFTEAMKDRPIPPPVIDALTRLATMRQNAELSGLLAESALQDVADRAARLASVGVVQQ